MYQIVFTKGHYKQYCKLDNTLARFSQLCKNGACSRLSVVGDEQKRRARENTVVVR